MRQKRAILIVWVFGREPGGNKYQQDMARLGRRSRLTNGDHSNHNGTIEEIGGLVRKYEVAEAPALENLLRQALFNYLLSNGDAHFKCFSLIQINAGVCSCTCV